MQVNVKEAVSAIKEVAVELIRSGETEMAAYVMNMAENIENTAGDTETQEMMPGLETFNLDRMVGLFVGLAFAACFEDEKETPQPVTRLNETTH